MCAHLAFELNSEATAEEAIKAGKYSEKDKDTIEVGTAALDFVARLDPQIKSIGFDAYGAKLMLEIKDNPNFRQKVEEALKLRFQAFAGRRRLTEMMTDAIVRLRAATSTGSLLSRMASRSWRPMRDEDHEKVEAAAETVFVNHADWLGIPAHIIYTFWLRFRAPKPAPSPNREPPSCPMVRIAEKSGARYTEGIAKLGRLVGRRVLLAKVFGGALDDAPANHRGVGRLPA